MATKPIAHNLDSKWRSQDVKIQESADFSSLLLSNKLLAGLKRAGYQSPSPIQIKAIPVGRFGKDLVVQAKSGTGKTLVFTIVALEMILPDVTQPQVLIIAPTREIAHQICSVIQAVGCEFENLNCCTFIGGIPISDDKENISGCKIAVGTPGRIKQLIKEGILKTNCIRLFVLDEADQLLEASFLNDVDEIFLTLPKDKQVIAASATYPQKLKKLANRYFRNPHLARLNIDELALLGIVHYVQIVDVSDMPMLVYQKKLEYLAKILTSISFSQCLVFCNLLSRVPTLTSDIKEWGFTTTSISSNKEQVDRLKAIDKLKLFKCKVLVSSDLTSRGIDAENVNLIINFDLPVSTETYLHRVGRAGRYGSRGIAVTLLLPKQSETFKTMERSANFSSYDLPDPIPQNLMNVRPQGFQGPEDGFEISSEKSNSPDECIENQNSINCVNSTSDSECTKAECVESDFCEKQKEPRGGNDEKGLEESMNSDLCPSKNGLNNEHCNEKESPLKSARGENQDSSTCLEQKGASDENRKIDSPQNVESENPSQNERDGSEATTLLGNGSSCSENNDLYAGVANFLSQFQPTDSLNDTVSANQTEENVDDFYYQVFKSFAAENMPEVESSVPSNEAVKLFLASLDSEDRIRIETDYPLYCSESSSESDLDFSWGSGLDDSHSSVGIRYSSPSSCTTVDSEPVAGLLNGKSEIKFPFMSDFMVKGVDGWNKMKLHEDPMTDYIEKIKMVLLPSSGQKESNTGENDRASIHSLKNEVPEISEMENVHSSPGHAQVGLEFNPMPCRSTYASPAKSGSNVKTSLNVDRHSQSLRSCSSGNCSSDIGKRGSSKRSNYGHSQDYQTNSECEQRAINKYVHSSPGHAQKGLKLNPMSCKSKNASLAKSGNYVKTSPFVNGHSHSSHSCSPGNRSPDYGKSRSSKGSNNGHSQDYQTISKQRAQIRNQPQYGRTKNDVQSYPTSHWHLQPEANTASSQNAFNMGYYNCYSCPNYNHPRSNDTFSQTNCQTFQNYHYNSGNHSSSSNLWYDTFSKQWQHINSMCYFH